MLSGLEPTFSLNCITVQFSIYALRYKKSQRIFIENAKKKIIMVKCIRQSVFHSFLFFFFHAKSYAIIH